MKCFKALFGLIPLAFAIGCGLFNKAPNAKISKLNPNEFIEGFDSLMNLEIRIISMDSASKLDDESIQYLKVNKGEFSLFLQSNKTFISLVHLEIDSLNIDSIPDRILQMKNLEHLILSNNQIKSIPSWFFKLKKLTYLNLENNQLSSLPLTFFQIPKLQYLNLDHNQLNQLDPMICKFKSIREIKLNENELKDIPLCLSEIKSLERVELWGNKLSKPEQSLLRSKFKKINIRLGEQKKDN